MIASDPFDRLPLAGPDEIAALAPIVVVAPHPDDETLGTGGLIALLRRQGLRVDVILVSDGAGSHPNSKVYPPARLAEMRRTELEAALRILGVDPYRHLHALGYPDTAVPGSGAERHGEAVGRLAELIGALEPRTVLLPWRRDPHVDHRATFEIVQAALAGTSIRYLEYPIWLRVRGTPEDWPEGDELRGFGIDVRPVLEQKRRAVMAHVSQTTALVDDADEPFCLTEDVLALLTGPDEVLLEPA